MFVDLARLNNENRGHTMLEITPFELVDLLDAGFEPIQINYLCFLRWAVQHQEISEGSPETARSVGMSVSAGTDKGDPWDSARHWLGDSGR